MPKQKWEREEYRWQDMVRLAQKQNQVEECCWWLQALAKVNTCMAQDLGFCGLMQKDHPNIVAFYYKQGGSEAPILTQVLGERMFR